MNFQEYQVAVKQFSTYEARKEDPTLTVEEAFREKVADDIRLKRDELLAKSDWTQLADVMTDDPQGKEAWRTYRQTLRDMPQQESFPMQVTFPAAPTS